MAILDTGRLAATTIVRQSFGNLWNLLKDNVSVPTGIPSTHKLFYRRMPDIGRTFNGFPFIILSRTRPRKRRTLASGTKSFMDIDAMITVFAQDKMSNANAEPMGADMNDELTDSVRTILDKVSNKKSLNNNGMSNLEYDIDTDEDDFHGKFVFISEFDIRFVNTLQRTSA